MTELDLAIERLLAVCEELKAYQGPLVPMPPFILPAGVGLSQAEMDTRQGSKPKPRIGAA